VGAKEPSHHGLIHSQAFTGKESNGWPISRWPVPVGRAKQINSVHEEAETVVKSAQLCNAISCKYMSTIFTQWDNDLFGAHVGFVRSASASSIESPATEV